MENRSVELDMAEVTRAVNLSPHAGFADAVHVHGSKPVVVDTLRLGISIVIVDNRIVDDCD